MKKGNILIAAIAVLAAASVAKAEEIKVDFDGKGNKNISVKDLRSVSFGDDLAEPRSEAVSRCGSKKGREMCEDPETGACYVCPPGYIQMPKNESGQSEANRGLDRNMEHKGKSLKEILAGLTPGQRLFFFENLEFNEKGEVVSIYTRDVKENLGEKAAKEIMKTLGLKSDTLRDGRNEKWCVSKGTCGYNPGYYCTEKC